MAELALEASPVIEYAGPGSLKIQSGDLTVRNRAKALLATLKAGGDFRADKVVAIKQQIDAGTYETGAKMDAALDRLMDDLSR